MATTTIRGKRRELHKRQENVEEETEYVQPSSYKRIYRGSESSIGSVEIKDQEFIDCKVDLDDGIRYFRLLNGLWESEEKIDQRIWRKWLKKNGAFAKKCDKRTAKLTSKESKTPLKEVVIREGEENVYTIKNIEDCKPSKGKSPRQYLIKWEGYEDKSWEPEDNVDPCTMIQWYNDYPSKVKKCVPYDTDDVYDADERKTNPDKIKANTIFIQATQNVINETFLPQKVTINMLILDGENLNTTFRLLNEIKPQDAINSIIIPNPASSNLMRKFFCNDKRVAEKVELYNVSAGEYLNSLNPGEIEFGSIWLDYTGQFYKKSIYNPRTDIANLFEKKLLLDGAIFAFTISYSRGAEGKLQESFWQIPVFAKNNGYELESLCGLDYTYKCADPKLHSSFKYGRNISFAIFKVHKT